MGGPYTPSGPPPRYYRRRRSVILPSLLIIAGLVFLLQNLGVLSWDVWGSVARFWPIILVVIGLEMFLGGDRPLVTVLAVVAGVAVLIALLLGVGRFHRTAPARPVTSHTLSQSLQEANDAAVTVHFGAGSLNLGDLRDQTDQLANLTYEGPGQLTPPKFQLRNGHAQLIYDLPHPQFPGQASSPAQMNLLLSPNVPLSLDIQEGAADGRIDLSQLRVTNLSLQVGASHPTLVLPRNAGLTIASIKGGASTIDVEVPADVAAQIHYDGGLSTVSVDQGRFPAVGSQIYKSDDYDTAQNKVDLTIQAGLSTVTVSGAS